MQKTSAMGADLKAPGAELEEIPEEAFGGSPGECGFALNIRFKDEIYRLFCPVCRRSRFECREAVESESADAENWREQIFPRLSTNVICVYCKMPMSAAKSNGSGSGNRPAGSAKIQAGAEMRINGKKMRLLFHDIFCPLCGSRKFLQAGENGLLSCERGHLIGSRLLDKRNFH